MVRVGARRGKRMVITAEIEELPEDAQFLSLNVVVLQDGFLSRIFRDWKKVTMRPATITNLEIENV